MNPIVTIDRLHHQYPPTRKQQQPRTALKSVSLRIQQGEIFCLLGPNGSGKSTLFKILSTLIQPTSGTVTVLGNDLVTQPDAVRKNIGVVFQSPSLDKKLTARENLLHQGHLYGLRGESLKQKIAQMLTRVGLLDRQHDLVESLSGGNQRRIELAKGLLHTPKLVILDEPSTGIDPGARIEFMKYLKQLRDIDRVTIILTTHILEEADACDRIAIIHSGDVVALGTPQELKNEIGGDVITMTSKEAEKLSKGIADKFGDAPVVVDNTVRLERRNGSEHIPDLVHTFPDLIETVTLSKPTLEDVFIHKTGHRFWDFEQSK